MSRSEEPSPEEILHELDAILKLLGDLTAETKAKRDLVLQELELTCENPRYPHQQKCCGGKFKVKDASIIQTFWYEEPYSCTGGDHWHYGDQEILCPLCGARLKPSSYPLVEGRKDLFAKRLESHGKEMPPRIDEERR